MFTGIIEKTAEIKKISKTGLITGNPFSKDDLKLGESVAVNGVCLTLTSFSEKTLSFDLSPETFQRTNFRFSSCGCMANLERAMGLKDRFGGHFVTGHIDGLAEFIELKKLKSSYELKFKAPLSKGLAEKGSVTLNGISLTCYNVKGLFFQVSVIPHTILNTNLKFLKKEDLLNIEFDILGKYADNDRLAKSKITYEFLKENGFA